MVDRIIILDWNKTIIFNYTSTKAGLKKSLKKLEDLLSKNYKKDYSLQINRELFLSIRRLGDPLFLKQILPRMIIFTYIQSKDIIIRLKESEA